MSKRANPTVVGVFILSAIVLLVAGLVIFGGGSLFSHRSRAVVYFAENIQGLNVGAPVNLHGVRIGTVTSIRIVIDAEKRSFVVPVYLEFDSKLINFTAAKLTATDLAEQTMLKSAIDRGLHARLAMQSLVTGQLLVDLSFEPNSPQHFVGADPATVEIPSSPSDIERMKNTLAELPLAKIADAVLRSADNLDRLISSPEIPALMKSLTAASNSVTALSGSAGSVLDRGYNDFAETARAARSALAAAEATLTEARNTLRTSDRLMANDLKATLDAATAAMASADRALSNANTLMVNSQQRYDMDQTLRNLAATSRALRALADELERRPNAIIMGK